MKLKTALSAGKPPSWAGPASRIRKSAQSLKLSMIVLRFCFGVSGIRVSGAVLKDKTVKGPAAPQGPLGPEEQQRTLDQEPTTELTEKDCNDMGLVLEDDECVDSGCDPDTQVFNPDTGDCEDLDQGANLGQEQLDLEAQDPEVQFEQDPSGSGGTGEGDWTQTKTQTAQAETMKTMASKKQQEKSGS